MGDLLVKYYNHREVKKNKYPHISSTSAAAAKAAANSIPILVQLPDFVQSSKVHQAGHNDLETHNQQHVMG